MQTFEIQGRRVEGSYNLQIYRWLKFKIGLENDMVQDRDLYQSCLDSLHIDHSVCL